MRKRNKLYRVRCTYMGQRVFISALSYADAVRLQKRFGGKVV